MRNDLTIYSDYAHEWWIPGAPRFRSLQALSPFRLKLIAEFVGDVKDKRVIDIGSGGGLLSKPLIQQGALLTAIDLSEASTRAAREACDGKGEFITADARKLPCDDNSFDIAIMADLLDHIPDYSKAIGEAARVLKPGGLCYIGTINRNPLAAFLTITLGEGLGLIPKGTHDSKLFIQPDELIRSARTSGLKFERIQGEGVCFWKTIRTWSIHLKKAASVKLAYAVLLRK